MKQMPLLENTHNDVMLPTNAEPKRFKHSNNSEPPNSRIAEFDNHNIAVSEAGIAAKVEGGEEQLLNEEVAKEDSNCQLAFRTVSGERNVYNRERLYEEVWSKPVVQVALQYGVSDVAIHKVCKSLNVPVSP